ncbi:MAG: AAA family ATPase [Bacteroidales bacterium]|nr:AAA family ATPase [Bacteroidales bacterium]
MYLQRTIDKELQKWAMEADRKPLLLRGARQVGKSSTVRKLAQQFRYFLEVNFEEQKTVHQLFSGDLSPLDLCNNLTILYGIPIIPGQTLLFFDEIQACPVAISSLRFFYEKYRELHVIAAGSLLEFALEELPSFGVGRIRSVFLYPFSFDEFLYAIGAEALSKSKAVASPEKPLPEPIHKKLIFHLKQFILLGGMPEVVSRFVGGSDLLACQQVLDDLILSLKSDFAKYKKRVPPLRIMEVFESVVLQTGNKFTFSKVTSESNHKQIKEALELLIMAGLAIPVTHTAATGLPLGATINPGRRKMLVFDTGICQRLQGMKLADFLFFDGFRAVNQGSIAELFTGLELVKYASAYQQKSLYYWQREKLNSHAEVDYIVQNQDDIIPIEVKSGTQGAMQSLFLFLKEKNKPFGIRCSLENYSQFDKIRVYPLYSISSFANKFTSSD